MSSTDLSPTSAVPGPIAPDGLLEDGADPELLALPDPPRRERTWTLAVLALTALAAFSMVLLLARDAGYAFAPKWPTELGDLRFFNPAVAGDNHFVRGHGVLGAVGSMRFERPFEADSYRVAPIAGRPDVWVEFRVPAGEEGGRFVPPSEFNGRLVRFDGAGPRHRGLRAAIHDTTGETVPEGAWLLVNQETPDRAQWAVALVMIFFGFAGWNAGAFLRLVRRVR